MNTPPLNTNGYDETHNERNKKYGKYYGKGGIQSKYPLNKKQISLECVKPGKKFSVTIWYGKAENTTEKDSEKESRTKVDLL